MRSSIKRDRGKRRLRMLLALPARHNAAAFGALPIHSAYKLDLGLHVRHSLCLGAIVSDDPKTVRRVASACERQRHGQQPVNANSRGMRQCSKYTFISLCSKA
eukprot:3507660-Pleurochrysis_carterae.AAC.2